MRKETCEVLVTVPARQMPLFEAIAREAGWRLWDTGNRVATDEGEDAEAEILVIAPAPVTKGKVALFI